MRALLILVLAALPARALDLGSITLEDVRSLSAPKVVAAPVPAKPRGARETWGFKEKKTNEDGTLTVVAPCAKSPSGGCLPFSLNESHTQGICKHFGAIASLNGTVLRGAGAAAVASEEGELERVLEPAPRIVIETITCAVEWWHLYARRDTL